MEHELSRKLKTITLRLRENEKKIVFFFAGMRGRFMERKTKYSYFNDHFYEFDLNCINKRYFPFLPIRKRKTTKKNHMCLCLCLRLSPLTKCYTKIV